MNASWVVAVSVLTVCAAGCGPSIELNTQEKPRTKADFDPRVNYAHYGTYFMLKGNSSGNPAVDQRLSDDVKSGLASKGWVEVPEGEGQAAVIVHTATPQAHTYGGFYQGWGGWTSRPEAGPRKEPFDEEYKTGTVVVTIFDTTNRQAIWRGFADDVVSDKPKDPDKIHRGALYKMLERFPGPQYGLPDEAPADIAAAEASAETIVFSTTPALLIRIDGNPVYRDIEGTTLQRIVNAKYLIVRDITGAHYLKILDGWMEAYSLEDGWWTVSGVPPSDAATAVKQAVAAKNIDLLDGTTLKWANSTNRLSEGGAPSVFVTTVPAALVVSDGPLNFAPLPGSALEYARNTSSQVFREPTDQELYVFLSGRWFRSWKTDGPWQAIPAGELPADLAKLPDSRLKSKPGGQS